MIETFNLTIVNNQPPQCLDFAGDVLFSQISNFSAMEVYVEINNQAILKLPGFSTQIFNFKEVNLKNLKFFMLTEELVPFINTTNKPFSSHIEVFVSVNNNWLYKLKSIIASIFS